ncbi:MbcA/ParS/Xre antitoxin family protein [Marinomonas primoryensis]|uniref:DUF2384 domain-containing protein n=1 Tax=Marinomonas primoryensis TaxID=178399 RepID=A0A859CW27_9GAMM|nr:MbcA/ParS/Xre antitoxin family protein [Marinomonas primoryensis]QKK80352.1 DUF2384 domain-containing protein [Marinomonas primoryensis]
MTFKTKNDDPRRLKLYLSIEEMVVGLLHHSSSSYELQELLGIVKTFEKYRDNHSCVVAGQIDVLRVYIHAAKVYESVELANEWMHSRIVALGGHIPASLLETDDGRKAVRQTLRKIEFGEYA